MEFIITYAISNVIFMKRICDIEDKLFGIMKMAFQDIKHKMLFMNHSFGLAKLMTLPFTKLENLTKAKKDLKIKSQKTAKYGHQTQMDD